MRRRNKKRPMAEINVVPYIDVMLVLLIIFMVTAPLMSQGIDVDLPQATSEPLARNDIEPVVVSIDQDGAYYLNLAAEPTVALDSHSLQVKVAAILRHRADTPVLVRGDENVAYGAVVKVMTLLQASGAPSVGLMTQEPVAGAGS